MDPSIMKLLEEDEDESMHSGADVDAFTAALNRDIEGGSSSSQFTHSDISFSQENSQTSSQMYSQWQPSSQDENSGNQSQQQGLRSQEQQSSEVEMKEHGSGMEIQPEVNGSQAPSGPHPQLQRPVQVDGQGHSGEPNSGDVSQSSMPMQPQLSGTTLAQVHEPSTSRMLNSSSESQFSNMQRFSNQPVPAPDQGGSAGNRAKQIPFGSLLPIILPELDKDKSMQLQTLYGKLRKNEIAKDVFVRLMKSIVGDQMLRLSVVKMQAKMQSQSHGQQPHLRPSGTAAKFSDPYSFGQLHQNSHSTPMMVRTPTSATLPLKDLGHQAVGSNSLKSRDMEHPIDSRGMQVNQLSDRSAISIQGLSKQQQQHLHFSQSSFPMYGASSYHSFTGTNVSTPSTLAKPQPHDPQVTQGQLHQGFGAAHGEGTNQAINVTPKVERHNSFNDPRRIVGVTMPQSNLSTPSVQHNLAPWQISKEQKIGAPLNMSYVKQEPSEQALEKLPKPQISSSQGSIFPGAVLVDQGESSPVHSHDERLERPNPGTAFPSSLRTATVVTSASIPPPMDTDFQVGSQSTSATPASGIGGNFKASAKKPSIVQKKPLDASPPLTSKKQKVSGAFADESIELLNDVTAVSGVNLREEEEQLFSATKDDSRISEVSRKAVQEEEDRLILQKVPLQKKLAEIMTKCGLKNLSHDVERCLSLCVEERLRGLISSLIRVSKQRADSEKSRHGMVVTSDVREQILEINRKAREEWDKKQAEAEKLRKQNEQPDSSGVVDADKEKDEGRAKSLKMPVNKEEDDKMRTTAANVAARAAVGGDDMLSRWQLMAQARPKRGGGLEIANSFQAGKEATSKQLASSTGNVMETRGTGKRDPSAALSASGMVRQGGRNQVVVPPPRVAPRISVKDVIAVLEKEPQMAKSTIIYRLYDKMHAETAAE